MQALVVAGADVQGVWWFTDRWLLDDDAEVTDLATLLGMESTDPSRLRRAAVDRLGSEMRARQLVAQVTSTTTTVPTGSATAVPDGTTVATEPTTTVPADTTSSTIAATDATTPEGEVSPNDELDDPRRPCRQRLHRVRNGPGWT